MLTPCMRSLRPRTVLAIAGIVAGLSACPPRRGMVPMAGPRNPSTACVFGLRGVRIAVDESDDRTVAVTMTMSSDIDELRHRAHLLIGTETPGAGALADAGIERPPPLRRPARTEVEDVPGGVKIHVTPFTPGDLGEIRDEIHERIDRASDPDRCRGAAG